VGQRGAYPELLRQPGLIRWARYKQIIVKMRSNYVHIYLKEVLSSGSSS
jgi:hypothetical protein